MIFLNFKIYEETSGQNTLKLCQLVKKVNQEFNNVIIPCLQATDIYRVKDKLGIEVWGQHVDPIEFGKHTGWISSGSLKNVGASGTLINHNEHQVDLKTIKQAVNLCKKNNLKTLLGTDSIDLLRQVTQLNPDYITLESSEIIGGAVPMIDAKPELIKQAISITQQPFIIGGGIRTKEHVVKSLKAGAKGVLVASEIALSKDPEFTMRDLASGFK